MFISYVLFSQEVIIGGIIKLGGQIQGKQCMRYTNRKPELCN